MDIAASIQEVLNEAVLRMTRSLAKETGMKNLCLAGGVALNCVANGKILRDGAFERIWIQPAAGDAGGALGAALAAYHQHQNQPRTVHPNDSMHGAYLGPAFEQRDIEARQAADIAKLASLLKNDVVLTMPPLPLRYGGRDEVNEFYRKVAFRAPDQFRLVATRASRQLAVAVYRLDSASGVYRAVGIWVLTADGGAIDEITAFVDRALVPAFGLPSEMPNCPNTPTPSLGFAADW